MNVTVTVAPAAEPVLLVDLKLDLRIDFTDEDSRLNGLIGASRRFFEEQTGWALITRTLAAHLRFWPRASTIPLPYPPLQSVTSVVYQGVAGAVTVAGTVYAADLYREWGSVSLLPAQVWPTAALYVPGITITYVAGFGLAAAVPEDIRQALKMLCAYWYENPEAVFVPGEKRVGEPAVLPLGLQDVIDRYRKVRRP